MHLTDAKATPAEASGNCLSSIRLFRGSFNSAPSPSSMISPLGTSPSLSLSLALSLSPDPPLAYL